MSTPAEAARLVEEASRLSALADGAARAEPLFRRALTIDPASARAALGLSDALIRLGRIGDAVKVTAPFAARPDAQHAVLTAHAEALRRADRPDEALSLYRRAADAFPGSAVAAHNLAGMLGDLSRYDEALKWSRAAVEKGESGPATWLVMARALQGLGDLDRSESAYYEVLTRDPRDGEAQRELAQLIWMRTADAGKALAPIDIALRAGGPDPRLLEVRAVVQKFCGQPAAAYATISRAAQLFPGDAAVRVSASHLAIGRGRLDEALAHARGAVEADRTSRWTLLALCEALLAAGDATRAAPIIADLRAAAPLDQNVIAYQATAWRLLGDRRYRELYDYDSLVSTDVIATPPGWSRLEDYLAELAEVLNGAHLFRTHPFQQSVLEGAQLPNVEAIAHPAVTALFQALREPIARHVRSLGRGTDPVRSRNTGGTRYQGTWSVRLAAGGGRHVSHVHHQGWLSSAFYVALPQGVAGSPTREGWLHLGQPGIATQPALSPERFIEPKPGQLVLFPSYMWHGTEPFSGSGSRLSVAFDLLPA